MLFDNFGLPIFQKIVDIAVYVSTLHQKHEDLVPLHTASSLRLGSVTAASCDTFHLETTLRGLHFFNVDKRFACPCQFVYQKRCSFTIICLLLSSLTLWGSHTTKLRSFIQNQGTLLYASRADLVSAQASLVRPCHAVSGLGLTPE